jgi:hypothetical protein
VLLAGLAAAASGQELRLVSQNDFLTNNPTDDDHYTSSIELELERGPYTISFREHAFTDREADLRFDETYLTVERTFGGPGPWLVTAEAGVVHVGRGVFGQDLQNAIHRVLGNTPVDFEYIGNRVRPSVAAVADRPSWITRDVALGPRLEAFAAPGLRAHAVLAAQVAWRANRHLDVHVVAGVRGSHAWLDLLEPHTAGVAPLARVGVELYDRVQLTWTYNDFGDRREHVGIGYRFGFGRSDEDPPLEQRRRSER